MARMGHGHAQIHESGGMRQRPHGNNVYAKLCQAGNASGIHPAGNLDFSRIADPYFTTKQDGSGLGLFVVDRIVRTHGGELAIENTEHGAALTLSLPLQERRLRLLKSGDTAIDITPAPGTDTHTNRDPTNGHTHSNHGRTPQ